MMAISLLLIGIVCFVLVKSVIEFIQGGTKKANERITEKRFSTEIFCTLLITYSIVIIGFGLIYFIISFQSMILVEGNDLREVTIVGSIIHSFYFSGVTMLTIGYGDIAPVGIGRLIALIQALIGYVLPTAFVLRLVVNTQTKVEE